MLDRLPSITLFSPASVSALTSPANGDQASLILENGTTLRAPLVVAADGANSRVRNMAHLETVEWDYGHTAIVATVTSEKDHQYCARQRFTETGTLAFLPLETSQGETNLSSIVWSTDPDHAEHLLKLDDEAFCNELGKAFEDKLGKITHSSPRFGFPLRQRHCKSYYVPGIVAAGDAAHTIHPLAGQGVNLGFQDVRVLAEEINRALSRDLPLHDTSILQRYQRRRKGPNLAMMGVMEGFKQLFGQDSLALRWLRNEGMNKINQLPQVKTRLIREAMGIKS
jgi:2-octaprenylphenol hydroxylase